MLIGDNAMKKSLLYSDKSSSRKIHSCNYDFINHLAGGIHIKNIKIKKNKKEQKKKQNIC